MVGCDCSRNRPPPKLTHVDAADRQLPCRRNQGVHHVDRQTLETDSPPQDVRERRLPVRRCEQLSGVPEEPFRFVAPLGFTKQRCRHDIRVDYEPQDLPSEIA